MIIHNLSDFPYQYVTEGNETDKVNVLDELCKQLKGHKPDFCTKSGEKVEWVQDWHNDPKHNVEPISSKTRTMVENLTNAYEVDKRVERFFLGQQGEVWIVWHITDIPERSDNQDYTNIAEKSLTTGNSWGFVASDGMLTMVTAELYFTQKRAMSSIREELAMLERYAHSADETFNSHVYELSAM